ncbi:MAG TPA: DUF481 domain-containing protein [Gemmatimonadaceae bacterium]|nr:DUF481 domain-containing protein [Gemmatimonadaceae bacterium]
MRYLALAAFLPILASTLHAQGPKRKIEGEVAGSYFFGNTRQTVSSTRAQFERSDSGFTFRTMARFNYGELTQDVIGTTVNKRSWEAGANYDFHPYADFTPFVKAMIESSLENRIQRRVSAGVGSRYNIIRTTATDLIFSLGAAGEQTEPLVPAGAPALETKTLARGSSEIRLRREFSPTVGFTMETRYQPALTGPSDYTITSVNTLKMRLARFAALTLTFRDNYDNQAVARGARVNNDGEVLVGLLTTF